jgi:hypothetical protein
MAPGYLYLNSVLYLAFAVWCTVASQSTSTNLGYLTLSNGGRSEYLVIYGGLQLGLAVLFFLVARDAAYVRLGMLISIGLYLPIVLFRLITVSINWPVPALTLATGGLETMLLIAALWLYFSNASTG